MKNPRAQIEWLNDPSHLALAKIVERIVRPVHTMDAAKRGMREELIAHLTFIYEEEFRLRGEPDSALRAASERFGDSAELTRDLQDAQPLGARFAYRVERILRWHPREAAAGYMARQVAWSYAFIGLLFVMIAAIAIFDGWTASRWHESRWLLIILAVTPVAPLSGLPLYYAMRNAIWGNFAAFRAEIKVRLSVIATANALLVGGFTFALVTAWNAPHVIRLGESLSVTFVAAFLPALLCYVAARSKDGLAEIADANWDCLEIEG